MSEPPSAQPGALSHLGWTLRFVKPVKREAALAAIALILWTGAEILAVQQTAQAVNELARLDLSERISGGLWAWISGERADAARVRAAVGAVLGVGLALALLTMLRELVNVQLSMNLVYHIRSAVYDKLQRVGLGFHDTVSTGELINRAFSDLNSIRVFLSSGLLLALEIVLIVGGYLILLLTRSPWVALLSVAPLPIWGWYILRFSRKVRPAQGAVMKAGDRNVALLTENVAGAAVVRAFAAQEHEIRRYGESCDDFFAAVMRRIRLYANFTPVIRGISIAAQLGLFAAAGILMLRGGMQPGDLLMLGAAMTAILGRLQQVSVINDQYQNARVSAGRLREILDAQPTVAEASTGSTLPPGGGRVEFRSVTFGYDPARPVLHDVSFVIPAGTIAALVGPTGAGKSTLVQLLARLYSPQRGSILIDDVDIATVSLEDLHRRIALVFQETYLFSDSAAGNIAYAQPGANDQDILRAAEIAGATEFLSELPGGLQTIIGERGATLSGGQRQRLALARAVLAQPRILILDDATSAVDSETEALIRGNLEGVMQQRTTLIIAHRISTVRAADLVIVLEAGRITAMGPHDELIRQDGHYRDIARAQLSIDDVGPTAPAYAEPGANPR